MEDSGDSEIRGNSGNSLHVTKIENLLEPQRKREIGSLRGWNIRELREIIICAKKLKNRRLEDTGDPKLTNLGKIVICGTSGKLWRGERMGIRRIGKFGGFGNSDGWKIREIGRFRRLGDSGNLGDSEDWKIREGGKNHYLWKIIKTSWRPGTPDAFGRFLRFQRLGDSGDSGNSGTSEASGKSLHVPKIKNLSGPKMIGVIEGFRRFRKLGNTGDLGIREMRSSRVRGKPLYVAEVGSTDGANTREADELGNLGDWEIQTVGRWEVQEDGRFRRMGSRRIGKLGGSGIWEIREIWETREAGRFGRLAKNNYSGGWGKPLGAPEALTDPGDSGDSSDWEIPKPRKIRVIREIGALGKFSWGHRNPGDWKIRDIPEIARFGRLE